LFNAFHEKVTKYQESTPSPYPRTLPKWNCITKSIENHEELEKELDEEIERRREKYMSKQDSIIKRETNQEPNPKVFCTIKKNNA
jgi:hypothetical protein